MSTRALALVMLVAACAGRRPEVRGGRFAPGLSEGEREKLLAVCRAALGGESCGPNILHDELTGAPPVEVASFAMDKLEASQARYRKCVAAGACPAIDRAACVYGNGKGPTDEEWKVLEAADHPVVCVSFAMAERYCRWAGGRVPTEAEWEYAARGGDARLFPWGDDWRPAALNWGEDGKVDGHVLTSPVGVYADGASAAGVRDLVGNVWEWARRIPGPEDKPEQAGREVIRGGGFAATVHAQRVTKRAVYDPSRGYPNVGLRCVY